MATNTTRLSLIKPDYVDVVDVEDLNSNADAIDAAVGFTICTSTTRPASPYVGQAIFETDTLTGFTWDGSAWQVTSGASTTTADTAPSSPKVGDLWWDSTDGSLYVWYEDVDGSQWVGIRAASSSASIDVDDVEPGSPLTGNLWWNTDVESGKSLNVYNGSSWVNAQPLSNNAIINGDFGIWQRGTSFGPSTTNEYTADRWYVNRSLATATVSRQSFTPGDIQAIGYGSAEHYLKLDVTTGDNFCQMWQLIEDVRTFAGQKVTLSFWAKGVNPGGGSFNVDVRQEFGSGGSSSAIAVSTSQAISATWTRYSFTITIPSVSGKTIGTGSHLRFGIGQFFSDTSTDAWELDLWGFQLEAGSVATPFRLAGGGSKAAELALCQRYYYRITAEAIPEGVALGQALGSTVADVLIPLPKNFRIRPTAVEQSGTASHYQMTNSGGSRRDFTAVPSFSSRSSKQLAMVTATTTDLAAGNSTYLLINNTDAYLGWSAEL